MMTEMLIDNQDVSIFGARLLTYSVGGTTITRNNSIINNICKIPSVISTSITTRQLSITLVFKPAMPGESSKKSNVFKKLNASTTNITKFEGYLLSHGTVEINLPDGFIYSCVCVSIGAAVFDGTGEQEVTYTFTAVRHKVLQKVDFIGAKKDILCEATTPVYCCISLIADQNYNSITIMGITVNRILAGDVLMIDGLNGKITINDENRFLDSDLVEFPILQPGINSIITTAEKAQCSISYYPILC